MTDRELLLEILEGINDVDRTGDTQVFSGYIAPRLRELIFERLEQPEQPAQKPLTDEEIKRIEETTECVAGESWLRNLCRNIEAAHNIK